MIIKKGKEVDWISADLRHFPEPLGRKNKRSANGFVFSYERFTGDLMNIFLLCNFLRSRVLRKVMYIMPRQLWGFDNCL